MYEVDFTLSGWAGAETHTVRGETASDLLWEIGNYQDLDCLVRMGKEFEDEDGQKEVRKLERLLKRTTKGPSRSKTFPALKPTFPWADSGSSPSARLRMNKPNRRKNDGTV